ncbi:L-type lectin-domain containing receptor kinase IX.1 [Jatropha curcas]|uniref:L-type lectin-domain containing receptor kinase IX.1 n=1 Tax=Jatropha curcas TaxID=180498 RepID=UPI001894DAB5|nr:L-type lectin-domain containing receptor kinase IX.1 [Jatropha curcas]
MASYSIFTTSKMTLSFQIIFFFLIITHTTSLTLNFSSFNPNSRCLNYERNTSVSQNAIYLTTDNSTTWVIGRVTYCKPFNSTNLGITVCLNYERNTSVSQNAIYLTTDNSTTWVIGRVTYCKPVYLWNKTSRNLTDFHTAFSFSIESKDLTTSGDGMTFFLSSENFTLGDHFAGGGLGLAIENQTSKYPFLAVEFDTFRNSWDPSSRQHVGIDINSVNSNITTDWSWSKGMEDGQKVNASITYDSTLKRLTVSFTAFSNNDELIEQNLIYDVDLRDYLPEWVNIGFSAATGSAFEQHNLYSWFFTSNLQEPKHIPKHIVPKDNTLQITDVPKNNTSTNRSNSNKVIGLAIGLSIGLCVFVGVIISSLSYFCCWKESKEEEGNEFIPNLSIDDEFGKNNGPRKFSYNDLVRATNNFSEQEKLGEGGFGAVYRGYLKEVDLFVAVKRISRESKQGIREYASEVKVISQLRHRNLVQLLGWCHERGELLLVYEFMPNGSLDSHLFKDLNFIIAKN